MRNFKHVISGTGIMIGFSSLANAMGKQPLECSYKSLLKYVGSIESDSGTNIFEEIFQDHYEAPFATYKLNDDYQSELKHFLTACPSKNYSNEQIVTMLKKLHGTKTYAVLNDDTFSTEMFSPEENLWGKLVEAYDIQF